MANEEKTWSAKQKIEVKFLENGYPWGYAYHKDTRATVNITQEKYNLLVSKKVITKV